MLKPERGIPMALRASSLRSVARWTERGLLAVSLLLMGWWVTARLEASSWQTLHERRLEDAARPETPLRASAPDDGVVGRIDIPRVGVAAVIADGIDDDTLSHAVGHIPGTALPGRSGNVGLAGHRDSYFRGLRDLRRQDRIKLSTPDSYYEYAVDSIQVVEPGRVDLLAPTTEPSLTLVTCYPFHYVGRAPKRFVVRALLVADEARTP